MQACRAVFGDDSQDYGEALQRHYRGETRVGWQTNHVSAYATVHPWEDFAETWAHYLHIVDTLEAAAAFGLKIKPRRARGALAAAIDFDPYHASIDRLIDAWLPVEFATNSMNRSMGLNDLYPFLLSAKAIEKYANSLLESDASDATANTIAMFMRVIAPLSNQTHTNATLMPAQRFKRSMRRLARSPARTAQNTPTATAFAAMYASPESGRNIQGDACSGPRMLF